MRSPPLLSPFEIKAERIKEQGLLNMAKGPSGYSLMGRNVKSHTVLQNIHQTRATPRKSPHFIIYH